MREMKDSGVPWIQLIPVNWELKKIKFLLVDRVEKNNPIKTTDVLSLTAKQGVIPLSEKECGGNKPKEDFSQYHLAYPGDIVMNSMNILSGAVGLSKYFGCVSPVYYMLRPQNKDEDVRFYNYIFQTKVFQRSLFGLGNGILIKESDTGNLNTIRMRIPMDKFSNLYLPVATPFEQERIASFLDTKCTEIDSIAEDIRKEIETLQEYRKSVITEAVTKGLDPNVEMKDSGVEWIGEIPVHWNILPFKSQFILSKGLNITKADLVDEGIPVVSYGQIHAKYCDGVHLLERQLRYLPTTRVFPETCIIKKDDIVFADTSEDKEGTGNAVRNSRDDKVFAGYHTIIARPKIITDTRYMSYQFKTLEWRSQLIRYEAVKVYSITQNLLNRTSLIVPPLSVQLLISDYLDSKCAEIDAVISDKQKQLETLAEYRKSLIYEYVTGKKEVPTA